LLDDQSTLVLIVLLRKRKKTA